MRSLFWRRKDARLASRLDTLKETAERKNKQRPRKKPRVVIDTSFVQDAGPALLEVTQAPEAGHRDAVPRNDTSSHLDYDNPADTHPAMADESSGIGDTGLTGDDQHPAPASEQAHEPEREVRPVIATEELDEQEAVLQEAVEQLDAAEAREAAAVARAQAAEAEANLLRSEIERERQTAGHDDAADESGAHEGTLADLNAEIADQSARIAHLEADILDEQRRRADVTARAERLATDLKALEKTRDQTATAHPDVEKLEAKAREAEAGLESARHEIDRLATELNQKTHAHNALEAAMKGAVAAQTAAEAREKVSAGRLADMEGKAAETTKAAEEAEALREALASVRAELKKQAERTAAAEARGEELTAEVAQLTALKEKLSVAEAAAEAAKAEVHSMRDALETARADLQEAHSVHADKIKSLDITAADMSNEIAALRRQAAESEDTLAAANECLKEAERNLAKARADSDKARNERDDLKREAGEAKKQADRLLRDQQDAIAREGALKLALATAEARLSALETTAAAGPESGAAPDAETDSQIQTATDQQAAGHRPGDTSTARRKEHSAADEASPNSTGPSGQPFHTVSDMAATDQDRTAPELESGTTFPEARESKPVPEQTPPLVEDEGEREKAGAVQDRGENHAKNVAESLTATFAKRLGTDAKRKMDTMFKGSTADTNTAPDAELGIKTPPGGSPAKRQPRRRATVTSNDTAVERIALPSRAEKIIQSRIARATAAKERAKDSRRAKRMSARKLASLWQEGMSTALSCTMLDRSSSGAKLEVVEDRFNDRFNEINIGDRFTLTLNYAKERTWMDCEVMWVAGRRCGVRFCGQIQTANNKAPKRAAPPQEPQKPASKKSLASSLFGGR